MDLFVWRAQELTSTICYNLQTLHFGSRVCMCLLIMFRISCLPEVTVTESGAVADSSFDVSVATT